MDISATERSRSFEESDDFSTAERSRYRKVGRPRKVRPKDDDSETVIRVEEDFKNVPKQTKPQDIRSNEAVKKEATANAAAVVPLMITMLNGMAIAAAGPEATIQPNEKMLIETGLTRTLARATPKQIEKYGAILDPLMIGFGFVLWGKRIVRLNSINQQQKATDTAAESSGIASASPQIPSETLIPKGNGTVVQEGEVTAAPPPDAISGRWNNQL